MLTCEFCKKEYSSKSTLNYHIKTNKKCILLRGDSIESKEVFNCEYCQFTTLTKSALKLHLCKNKTELETKQSFEDLIEENKKMEEKIKLLEKQIKTQSKKSEVETKKLMTETEKLSSLQTELKIQKEYTSKLEEKIKTHEYQLFTLASKSTTTTSNVRINNVYNNLETLDLNEDKIRRAVEDNFTDNHFNDGIKGVARFTKDYILNSNEEGKTKYICSDISRGIFKYLDENGLLQKDVKASKLKNSIQAPISKKSYSMFMIKLDEEENNDKEIEVVHLNFSKLRNIDVNDYAKELALVV